MSFFGGLNDFVAHLIRPRRQLMGALWGAVMFVLPCNAVYGQLGGLLERATVFRNARILSMDGPVLEGGSIVIKGGRIQAIGKEVDAPLFSKTIDVSGRTITPGLIDGWSALGQAGHPAESDPLKRAWDNFDRYDRDAFREALRNGITAIYIGPGGGAGVGGVGAIVQLVPQRGRAAGELLKDDVALSIRLGSDRPAVARMQTFQAVRKAFRSAKEYRKSLEDYQEDLKEYLKKLEERRKKRETEGKETAAPQEEKPKNGSEENKNGEKPTPSPTPEGASGNRVLTPGQLEGGLVNRWRWLTAVQGSAADGSVENEKDERSEDAKEAGKKEEEKDKKKDELKKPTKPKHDSTSELLLKAIDHLLPVRIEAHRSADILNALELAVEFNLDIILEGATEAHLVVEQIARAGVPVVLGQAIRTDLFEPNEYRRHSNRNAAILEAAGIQWTAGSGASPARSAPFVGMNAQLSWAQFAGDDGVGSVIGAPPWLRTVTVDAARLLSVSDRIGRLSVGLQADLVIWDGEPGHPASRVEAVFVNGEVAYAAGVRGGAS